MGIPEKVAVIIDTEVDRRVHEEMCKVAEKVAHLYHVPLKIVRKDLLGDTYCMGVKKLGGLCTNKAVSEGYCLKHVHNKRPINPICGMVTENARHNHPFPSPPHPNCPACIEKKDVNAFRELSTMM